MGCFFVFPDALRPSFLKEALGCQSLPNAEGRQKIPDDILFFAEVGRLWRFIKKLEGRKATES